MLLKNGINLKQSLTEFIDASSDLFIFVPYIKLDALKALLDNVQSCRAIFVRWETKDLITGASDLEIYPYCKEKGISLFRNNRLHLKAYVEGYKKSLIGSSNISTRALNFPESDFYNYELATVVDDLTIEDKLYFSIIEQDSILITDSIYKQLSDQLPQKRKEYPNEADFEIRLITPDKDFLISSLPLTYSVETLFRIYQDKSYINDVELNCATHDLAIYKIPFDLPFEVFKSRLETSFFNHPFIKAFLENVDSKGEIYFGEAKAWIQANCSNVPLPRRWEITENIQILYRWIVKLGNGAYGQDRPNYSERLYKTVHINKQ